uniref:Tremerogen A-10 n=1 Tax=Tremella mesenterica TaxID=5217 RepID=TA10_TREME|nr:RecName: Full=Tremerogen A-10 [Tremella mesenterica]prf//0601162A tremerogen A10 [Tremella mesenterica]
EHDPSAPGNGYC